MMGKTHMVGALAAWSLLHPVISGPSFVTPQNVAVFAAGLGGAVLGGLLPDIDQPGSTIDHELFGPLGKTRIGAMVSGLLLLGVSVSLRIPALAGRMVTSQVLRDIVLHYGGEVSLVFGLLGAVLVMIASLKHRGITHTFLGMGLFLWGADTLLGFVPILLPWRVPLLIVFGAGYLSHLLLDLISDGVPLLYPVIRHRIKLPVSIRTGSFWDVVVVRLGLLVWIVYAEGLPLIHSLGISL